MSKKRSGGRGKNGSRSPRQTGPGQQRPRNVDLTQGPPRRRARLAAIVAGALIVCCVATSGILARRGIYSPISRSLGFPQASPSPTTTPTPSKEYIYAGDELIATEEPGGNTGPSPTPTTTPSGTPTPTPTATPTPSPSPSPTPTPGSPNLTSISPPSEPAALVSGETFTMTLLGSGLAGVNEVLFTPTSGEPGSGALGGTQVQASMDGNTVTTVVSIPNNTAVGTYNVQAVVVNTANGQMTFSNSEQFTITSSCPGLPTPTIATNGITTNTTGNPLIGQSFTMTVTGTNFQANGSTLLYVGGQLESQAQYISSTELQCALSFAQAGLYSVTVQTSSGDQGCVSLSATASQSLEIDNPFPVASTLSQTIVVAGGGALNLGVSGSGFYSGSVVQINGSSRPTTYSSSGSLTAALTAADTASPATYSVTVVNAGPGGGTSLNPPTLSVIAPPVLSNMSPQSANAGVTNMQVTISGSNFRSTDVVQATPSGGSATTLQATISATSVVATIPSAMTASGGTIAITVVDNFFGTFGPMTLTINNPVPAITGLSTATLTQGTTSPAFTISGSGFVPTSAVQLNGTGCGCTANVNPTAQTITVTLTSGQVSSPTTWTITVFNAAPSGGTSNSETLTILPPPPAAPTALTATAVSGTQINLAWTNNSTIATSITIERSTAGGSYSVVNSSVSPTATTYTDTGLSPDTKYSYQIFASNSGGSSGNSNQFTATTWALPPAAPTLLAATDSSSNPDGQINLTWTDLNPNEIGVKVERETGSGGYTQIAVLCPNTTSYSDTTVSAGLNYSYRVRAFNSAGDSPYSAAAPASTPALTAPTAPTGLTATAETGPEVALSWTNTANNATSIVVQRETGGTQSGFSTIATFTTTTTDSYPDTTVTTSTTYTYRVGAVNSDGTTYSSTVQVSIGATMLRMPSNLRAEPVSKVLYALAYPYEDLLRPSSSHADYWILQPMPAEAVRALSLTGFGSPPADPIGLVAWPIGGAQINLSWVPGDATQNGFTLQRATSSSGPFTTIASIDNCASMFTYTDTGLSSSTTYYYQVQAASASNGSSGSSDMASASTDSTPTITYLSPSYVLKESATPYTLTVNGSNFTSTSTVEVGGGSRTTTFVSATQLTAALTTTDLNAVAQLAITVVNTSPSATSNPQVLNVVANNTPAITSLSVTSLMEGSAGFNLTVTGTGFVSGSTVQISGAAATTTFYSPAELVAWVPATDLATAANLAITVANPSPGSTSSAATLAVDNPAPTLTSISPTTTGTDIQFSLTVNGTGFVTGSIIKVGSASVTPSSVSGGVLTATVPASDISTSGTVNITVVNSGPGGGTSNAESLTVTNEAPAAPTGVTATAESSSSIQLGWSQVSGATGYVVYFIGANGPEQIATISSGSTVTYTVTGLTENTQYCYELKATNSFGSSAAYSSQACATTPF